VVDNSGATRVGGLVSRKGVEFCDNGSSVGGVVVDIYARARAVEAVWFGFF